MISVCIASFNGEKYIKEQLESILLQLDKNDEVIISDDNSIDNTVEIIKSINDSRIFIYNNDGKKGLISNFENALKKAKGDFIFLSDQDDIWLPNKVNICMEKLDKYDLVLTDCQVVNDNLELIHSSFFQINSSKVGLINNLIKNSYIGCCIAFRRQILDLALPFPRLIPMHDIWLGFIAELFFKIEFIHTPLVSYRRHENNASISASISQYSLLKKIRFRFNTIRYIFTVFIRKFKKHK